MLSVRFEHVYFISRDTVKLMFIKNIKKKIKKSYIPYLKLLQIQQNVEAVKHPFFMAKWNIAIPQTRPL